VEIVVRVMRDIEKDTMSMNNRDRILCLINDLCSCCIPRLPAPMRKLSGLISLCMKFLE
jgi:hypothetical protein